MFTINNETWTVEYCHPQHPKLQQSDRHYAIGVCDDYDKTIYLNHNLHGAFLLKVLCHEITHAAMFSYNIELTLEQEELLANLIATYGKEIIDITNVMFKKIKGETYN